MKRRGSGNLFWVFTAASLVSAAICLASWYLAATTDRRAIRMAIEGVPSSRSEREQSLGPVYGTIAVISGVATIGLYVIAIRKDS